MVIALVRQFLSERPVICPEQGFSR